MSRLVMVLRRRVFQFIIGTVVLIFYIHFQLLSYSDRRIFLKKMSLTLPHLSGYREKLEQRCTRSTPSADLQGLTLFTWRSTYIKDLPSFIDFPLFPKHPASVQFNIRASLRIPLPISTGGWLFGWLHVPETGEYRFAISTNGEAKLTLSKDSEPESTRVIATLQSLSSTQTKPKPGDYKKYPEQHSVYVSLQKCKAYYIQVLFYTNSKDSHVELAWETPKSLKYQVIPTEYLSPYIRANDFANTAENLLIFEDNYKMNSLFTYVSRKKHSVEGENLEQWNRLPFMLSNHARNLPRCSENFKGFASSKGLVIPKVNTISTKKFVADYTGRLVKASNGKYTFRGIHHAEEKTLGEAGARYLINLEFQDNIMETRIRVSEYLFYENQKGDLCFVDDFTWKRGAMVTIIAVIPDMETWSHHFMDHLSVMTSKLQDSRFSVIFVAAQGLKQYFQTIVSQNTLAWHSHVTLLLLSEKDIKNMENVMKVCLAHITIPNTIVFFTDIRVQLPLKVLELVRKQTIEGKTTYIPWPENFDKGFQNNATIINPLDRTKADRPPSFAMYVSDLRKLTGQKSTNNRRKTKSTWKKDWWKDLVKNGDLEVYASKASNFLYYQQE